MLHIYSENFTEGNKAAAVNTNLENREHLRGIRKLYRYTDASPSLVKQNRVRISRMHYCLL